jgi:hypothetical protein
VDQANGFYTRSLVTRAGLLEELRVPRTRSGQFQTQVLERFSRRDALVNQLLRQVFLAGVSTPQTGATLAAWLGESGERHRRQRSVPGARRRGRRRSSPPLERHVSLPHFGCRQRAHSSGRSSAAARTVMRLRDY